MAATQLVVTAPLVIVHDEESDTRHHLYEGAPVPDFVQGDQRKRLEGDGLIGAPAESTAASAAKKSASSK